MTLKVFAAAVLGWVQCDENILALRTGTRLQLVDPVGDHRRGTGDVQSIPGAPTGFLLGHELGILAEDDGKFMIGATIRAAWFYLY